MATEKDRNQERATLHQVGTLAGVSVTTVSLVLAGKAGNRRISQETHEKVRKAAEKLNYAPNLLTRSLRDGRTNILSFFSTFRNREIDDFYMDKISSAIETAGGRECYDILVHCNFNRSPKEIYQFLNGGLADGLLLFAPEANDPLLPLLRKSSLPVVLINAKDPDGHYPSVADDMEQGMRLVADQLIANGHRRIAILTGEGPDVRDSSARVALLKANLAEVGIQIPERLIVECNPDRVLQSLQLVMDQPEPPTAIFCWHDRLAYKVLAVCETLSIDVPGQLSIIGYDGLPWPSATRHVSASVKVDLNALALSAVRLLDQYITGYRGPARHEVLPVTFSAGTSLGPSPTLQRSIHENQP